MFIVKYKNIFLGISALLVAGSLAALFFFGIRFGIDFTGGSLLEVEYATLSVQTSPANASDTPAVLTSSRPEIGEVKDALSKAGFSEATVQPTGEAGYILRTKSLSETEHAAMLGALSLGGEKHPIEKRFTSIGPVIGHELRAKAWVSIVAVLIAIVLFVAFAFRKVSIPVSSSKYGLITIVALVHDVIVPTGALALLGHFYGVEADVLFVTALLTILGFSVHDTIVVFDRVRENLKLKVSENFSEVVGISLRQTFVRSMNTSLTVVLVLAALLRFGPASTHNFSLILLIGIIAGTYSSVFLASPLLVLVEERQRQNKK